MGRCGSAASARQRAGRAAQLRRRSPCAAAHVLLLPPRPPTWLAFSSASVRVLETRGQSRRPARWRPAPASPTSPWACTRTLQVGHGQGERQGEGEAAPPLRLGQKLPLSPFRHPHCPADDGPGRSTPLGGTQAAPGAPPSADFASVVGSAPAGEHGLACCQLARRKRRKALRRSRKRRRRGSLLKEPSERLLAQLARPARPMRFSGAPVGGARAPLQAQAKNPSCRACASRPPCRQTLRLPLPLAGSAGFAGLAKSMALRIPRSSVSHLLEQRLRTTGVAGARARRDSRGEILRGLQAAVACFDAVAAQANALASCTCARWLSVAAVGGLPRAHSCPLAPRRTPTSRFAPTAPRPLQPPSRPRRAPPWMWARPARRPRRPPARATPRAGLARPLPPPAAACPRPTSPPARARPAPRAAAAAGARTACRGLACAAPF